MIGVKLAQERVEPREQRPRVVEHLLRSPAGPSSTPGPAGRGREQALQVGCQLVEVLRASATARGRPAAAGRPAGSCCSRSASGGAGRARPSRRKVGKTRNVSASCRVAARDRLPDPVRVPDQLAQLALALRERVEDVAGVAHEAAASRRSAGAAPAGRRPCSRRTASAPERVVQRLARCPSRPRPPGRARCEKRARVSGSKVRRISSSSTVSATWPAAAARRRRRVPASACRATAPRRSRRAASSGAGSRACRSGSARSGRRSRAPCR